MGFPTGTGTFAAKTSLVVDAAGSGDYTTIAAALTAVPAGGADIFVKRGTYSISATLNPPAKTTLRGEGDGTVLFLANATNANVIEVLAGATDVTIRNLRVDGNRSNQSGNSNVVKTNAARTNVLDVHAKSANGYNIVAFPGGDDMLVSRCFSEDSRDEGIEFQGASRCRALGNLVLNAGKNGIYVWANGGTCADCVVANNVVNGAAALSASYSGIRIDDGAIDTIVTGNMVLGGGTTAPGISVASSTASLVIGTVVTGNIVSGTTSTGINVQSAKDTTISANRVKNGALNGIFFDSSANGTTITGNIVTGCQRSGIIGFNAVDFSITGNVCRNNGQDQAQTNYYNGITLWNSSGSVDRGVVAHNRCYDDQGSKTQQYGIRTLNTIGASVSIGPNITDGNGTTGVAFSFGGATAPTALPWKKLTAVSVASTGSSIAHGLPYTPQSIVICMTSAGQVWKSGGSDGTSIVLTSDVTSRTCDVYVG